MQTLEEEVLEAFEDVKDSLKVSYPCKGLKLKKRKIFLVIEKLEKINVEEDLLLMPKIIAYGQIVDKDNNPLLSKDWYDLPRSVLGEICNICYDLD